MLADATAALFDAPDHDAGLHALPGPLVPRLANLAAVYVSAQDARLHPRAVTRSGDRAAERRVRLRGAVPGREAAPGADEILERGSDHPAAQSARTGRVVIVVGADPPYQAVAARDAVAEVREHPARGLAVPLEARDGVVGVLYLLLGGKERAYGPGEVALALSLGARTAVVLDNRRLAREIHEARRAKGDFLSIMSHELRTPLTAVVGYTDLLEAEIAGPVTAEQAVQLGRIKESAWDLLEMIEGLLGYARFESEEPVVVPVEVEVDQVLDEALAVIHAEVKRKGLELEIRVAGDVSTVHTDRAKLRQILVHLLDNAVKFTDSGSVTVRVERRGDRVSFAVADTGPGIPGEDRERVFEPFWQGERVETRTRGGTGMGLTLARRLAHVLDGEVRLERRPGRGSTFTLLLPAEPPHE